MLLYGAALSGNVLKARLLIALGADVNARRCLEETVLHVAARYGHLDFARMLLQRGLDVNARGDWGRPLHVAGDGGHVEFVRFLLNSGGSFGAELHDAIGRSDTKTSAQILRRDAGLVDAHDAHDWPPLAVAVRLGEAGMCRTLIERGADPFVLSPFDHTLLHVAARCGHAEVADLLIAENLDLEARTEHVYEWCGPFIPFGKETPLWLAARRGDRPTVEALLAQGADPNVSDALSQTPLHVAAEGGREEIVELLLSHGADPNAQDLWRQTPADLARGKGHKRVLAVLGEWAGGLLGDRTG